ncbi:hypothetical protein LTR66_010177 [Elasticomyces elasticus]|nr:hypothetical protein LTR66_010177 [Elasticomyces elasticus]KAK4991195.1 hypothetical protein LTR50_001953 [Elasticomyces elasticus]
MRRIIQFQRSVDLLLDASAPGTLCTTCQLRAASLQRRQFSSSTSRHATAETFLQSLEKRLAGKNPQSQFAELKKVRGEAKKELSEEEYEAFSREIDEAQEAPTPEPNFLDRDAANNPNYKPATTWIGLSRVGSEEWLERRRDKGPPYKGWLGGKTRGVRADHMQAIVRHTVVEALALQMAGRDVLEICNQPRGLPDLQRMALSASVRVEGSGKKVKLVYAAPEDQERLLDLPAVTAPKDIVEAVPETTEQHVDLANGVLTDSIEDEPLTKPTDQSKLDEMPDAKDVWLKISLDDLSLRFAIIKRLMQITGRRIPDNTMNDSSRVSILLGALMTKPKPKRLNQDLRARNQLTQVSNVEMSAKRVTPIDKEKKVGRWKVIEEELLRRGLPVTGHRDI